MQKAAVAALMLATLGSSACRDTAGVEDRLVTVRFAADSARADAEMLAGSNGTLRIDDVRFVVSGLTLERTTGSCSAGEDGCRRLPGGPFLVELPLDGRAVALTSAVVPPGRYSAVVFTVEDLDGDDDDERAALRPLLARLRQAYPDIPREASAVVRGRFTPTGGTPRPFTVYLDAESGMQMVLSPTIDVPGIPTLTVRVDPVLWFQDGTEVLDLSALDGRTVELTATIARGFVGVRVDD